MDVQHKASDSFLMQPNIPRLRGPIKGLIFKSSSSFDDDKVGSRVSPNSSAIVGFQTSPLDLSRKSCLQIGHSVRNNGGLDRTHCFKQAL